MQAPIPRTASLGSSMVPSGVDRRRIVSWRAASVEASATSGIAAAVVCNLDADPDLNPKCADALVVGRSSGGHMNRSLPALALASMSAVVLALPVAAGGKDVVTGTATFDTLDLSTASVSAQSDADGSHARGTYQFTD